MKRYVLMFAVAALSGCGFRHVSDYTPKSREYQQPVEVAPAKQATSDGSLFNPDAPLLGGVQDVRALGVNDVIVVQIVETAEAERSAGTNVERGGGMDFEIGAGGVPAQDIAESMKLGLGYNSDNFGSTARRDRVRATVAATVKQRFANGNLFIEGHRIVMVNDEEHHYYVSGVARPADIDAGNIIRSDRLADAQVELTGKGMVSDAQQPGWLTRFFKWISPF